MTADGCEDAVQVVSLKPPHGGFGSGSTVWIQMCSVIPACKPWLPSQALDELHSTLMVHATAASAATPASFASAADADGGGGPSPDAAAALSAMAMSVTAPAAADLTLHPLSVTHLDLSDNRVGR